MPDLVVRKRPHFPIDYLVCQWEKEGRSVERVERVDQKVEWPSHFARTVGMSGS